MKIHCVSFILLFSFSICAWGQIGKKQTITLNDGSQITGTIVSDSMEVMQVEVTTPQIIILKKSEIQSFKQYRSPEQIFARDRGYYLHFSSSVLSGKNDYGNIYSMSFLLSNGIQLNKGFGLGFGSGIEYLGVGLLPLYGEVKYFTLDKRISPYAFLKCGYGFAMLLEERYNYDYYYSQSRDPRGGVMFNAGLGLVNFTWQRAAVSLGVGYRYQKVTEYQPTYWWGTVTREVITYFNRIEFQLGFLFR
jgi:hypothetical protein